MRIALLVAAATALALSASPAGAQTLKPGLWEIHNKVDNADMSNAMARMQKEMESMKPEQRRQMEAVMAQRGMRVAPGAGGGMQVCMTKEMVERHEAPMRDGCRTTRQQQSGNTLKIAFTCDRPPSSGEGEVTFASPEAYSSRMKMTMTQQGRQQTSTVETSGKWLKADCGNVRPVQPRK